MKKSDQLIHAQVMALAVVFAFGAGLWHESMIRTLTFGAIAMVLIGVSIYHVGALHDEQDMQEDIQQRLHDNHRSLRDYLSCIMQDLTDIRKEQTDQRPTTIRHMPPEIMNVPEPTVKGSVKEVRRHGRR